ncbi:hypothetical protein Tco_0499419 [Tanacetum coccineum]
MSNSRAIRSTSGPWSSCLSILLGKEVAALHISFNGQVPVGSKRYIVLLYSEDRLRRSVPGSPRAVRDGKFGCPPQDPDKLDQLQMSWISSRSKRKRICLFIKRKSLSPKGERFGEASKVIEKDRLALTSLQNKLGLVMERARSYRRGHRVPLSTWSSDCTLDFRSLGMVCTTSGSDTFKSSFGVGNKCYQEEFPEPKKSREARNLDLRPIARRLTEFAWLKFGRMRPWDNTIEILSW